MDSTDAAPLAQIGLIGLAVMGSNLARNLARNGFRVAVYNRTPSKTKDFLAEYGTAGDFVGASDLPSLVASLTLPRKILIMVKAGAATDAVISELSELLAPGDIIIDGGNAHFSDTQRREAQLRERGLLFVGAGISGGEVGALEGPSIMPGGPSASYESVGPILEKIAAQVDGEPCCTHIGPDGAGHFVKMVHNGIEYADMQLIAEIFDLFLQAGIPPARQAEIFRSWNRGDLESYLIEITAEVLGQVDARTGTPLVSMIADAAAQKGTGSWTVQAALDLGATVNVIAEAVFARSTSAQSELRSAARAALVGPEEKINSPDEEQLIAQARSALWAAKVIAYAQGLDQIQAASQEYQWQIEISEVARIWRAGCIIRAQLLERIRSAYATAGLPTLLVAPSISAELAAAQTALRATVQQAVASGVPVPGLSSALAYYDTVRAERLPAALIQGLRDYFGAHTYRRTDAPGSYHTDWSGDRRETLAAE